ncbi:MAG: MerC domain-containing protein [Woeseiaceae bacterium]
MMKEAQLTTDKFAMTLSLACVIHCFFVPSFFILTSGFLSFSLDNEFIHKLLVWVAVPISSFALFTGYKNHKTTTFLPIGILGLTALIVAVVLGESMLGEYGEKGFTLLGSMLVALSHFKNYQICKKLDCTCHDE